MKKQIIPSKLRYLLVGLSVFIVAGACTLGAVAYAYKDTFYPGVTIAGVKLGGLSRIEGEAAVAARVQQYSDHKVVVTVPKVAEGLSVETGDYPDVEITTSTKELGLMFSQDDAQNKAWNLGHSNDVVTWLRTAIPAFFKPTAISLPYTIDQEQVGVFIQTQITPQVTTPEPAKLIIESGKISVESAVPGISIDQDKLAANLAKSLETVADMDTTYIRAPYEVLDSPVTAASILPVAEQLDKIGNLKVTMTTDGVSLVPKRDQLLKWFVVAQKTEEGGISLALNQDAVGSYLSNSAKNKLKQTESLKAVSTVLATYLQEDQTKVNYAKPVSVALVAKPVEQVDTTVTGVPTDLFAEKYIYVNLKQQRLSLVSNGAVEKTYVVSTGKWSTPTPVGTFRINGKITRAYSRRYGLYMPYWQSFIGTEYGIHELPEWPSGYKEGESHLGTPVSHGCIRLGIGSSKEVYDWTEVQTPIVIVQS